MLDSLIQNVLSFDWSVFVLTGGVLLLATELGYRLGQRYSPEQGKGASGAKRNLAGGVVGAAGTASRFHVRHGRRQIREPQATRARRSERHRHDVASCGIFE